MKTAALRGAPVPPLPPTKRTGSTATAATASSLDTMRYFETYPWCYILQNVSKLIL